MLPNFIFYEPVSLATKADFDEELLKKALLNDPERSALGVVRVVDQTRKEEVDWSFYLNILAKN